MAKLVLKSIAYYPQSQSGRPEAHKDIGLIDTDKPYKKLVVPAQNRQMYRLVDETNGEVLKYQKLIRDHNDLKVYVGDVVVVELQEFFAFPQAQSKLIDQEPLYMVDASESSCVRGLIGSNDGLNLPTMYVLWEPGMSVSSCLNPSALGLFPLPGLAGISGLTIGGLLGVSGALGALGGVSASQAAQPSFEIFATLSGKIIAGPVIAQSLLPGQSASLVSGLKVAAFDDKGNNIGSAVVDSNGNYSLQLTVKNYQGALLLKVYDDNLTDNITPQYRDEATGKAKAFTTLLSVVSCNSSQNYAGYTVHISPLTHLAALKAGAADNGTTVTVPTISQIDSANQQIAQKFLGTSVLLSASPTPTINADGTSNLAKANTYGSVLNVLSQLEKNSGQTTSQVAADLISLLNGQDANNTIANKLNLAAADALQSGVTSKDVRNITSAFGNQIATGSVTLNLSSPKEGDKLTLTVSDFVDANNTKADHSFTSKSTYQWQATADGVTWTNISGATNNSFTLTQTQVGKQVRALVKNTDDLFFSEYLVSPSTAKVANINHPPTGSVSVTGAMAQNSVLSLINTLNDADGLGVLSYQWQSSVSGSVWSNISAATTSNYTLTQAEVGKYIRVSISYTDGQGATEQVYSARTSQTVSNVNDSPQGNVLLNGSSAANLTFNQKDTLTASHNLTDTDNNGQAITGLTYQWQNSTNGIDWTDIANATSFSYTLQQSDVGKFVHVLAKYTDASLVNESKASASTDRIVNVNDLPTGSISFISFNGNLTEKTAITATVNLTDADGLGTLNYQWQSSNTVNGVWQDIANANSLSFTPANAQVGSYLRLKVSYTDQTKVAEVFYSEPTSSPIANVNDQPSGGVYVKGSNNASAVYTQKATLYASHDLSDADNNGAAISDIKYQWQNSTDGTTWTNIADATGTTYTLRQTDVGKYVHVRATYTDLHNTTETVDSVTSTPIANVDDLPAGQLKIYGSGSDMDVAPVYAQKSTLYALHTLKDADNNGVDSDNVSALSYQWQERSANATVWEDIANANGSSFTLTQAQVGKYVRVKVSYTDGGGYTNLVTSDTATATPVADIWEAPTLTLTKADKTFTESAGSLQGADVTGLFTSATVTDAENNNITSITLTVSNVQDGNLELLLVDGKTIALGSAVSTTALTGSTHSLSYTQTWDSSSNLSTIVLSKSGGVTLGEAKAIIESLGYRNTNIDNPTTGTRVVSVTQITDTGSGTSPDANTSNYSNLSANISVNPVNDAPTLTLTKTDKTFTEGSATTQGASQSVQGADVTGLFTAATLTDAENNNITSITLTVSNVQDGNLELLLVDGQTIALGSAVSTSALTGSSHSLSFTQTWDSSSNLSTIVLSKSGGVTLGEAKAIIESLGYRNTNIDNPTTGTRVVSVTQITDTGSGTSPDANTSNYTNLSANISVNAINDAPTLTLTKTDKTFTEGSAATQGASQSVQGADVTGLFTSATVTDAENNNITSITLTVSKVQDGNYELLLVDGKTIALGSAVSTTTVLTGSTHSLSYTQTWDSNNKLVTIVLSKAGGVTLGEAEDIIESLGYRNTNIDNPTAGTRVVSVTQITDTGSGTSPDANTSSYTNLSANISVNAVNDLPVNTVPDTRLTVGFNTATYISGLSVSDADSAASPIQVTLTVTHGVLDVISSNGVTPSGNRTASVILSGTESALRNLLTSNNAVTYTPSQDYGGADSLTMVSNDGGNTGAANGTYVSSVLNIYVNHSPAVITPASKIATAIEDTEIEITVDMLRTNTSATDTEDSTVNAFVVKTITSSGTVRIGTSRENASDWNASTNAVVDSNRNLYWKAAQDLNGFGLSAFTVAAKDSAGAESSTTATITLDVSAVNDAPKFTNAPPLAPVSTPMNTAYALPTGYSVDDVDAGNSANLKLSFTLKEGANASGTLAYVEGTSGVNWVSTNGNVYTFSGSLAQFNAWMNTPNFLRYVPSTGFTGDATIVMAINDSGARGSGSAITTTANALTINVKDVTPPVLTSISTDASGSKIILTYNEALSATTAAPANFRYSLNGTGSYTPDSVNVNGNTIELNLSSSNKPVNGDVIKVNYTVLTSDTSTSNAAVQDTTGNDAVAISTPINVTNNVLNIEPTISTTRVTNDIPTSAFKVNGYSSNVTAVVVNGNTVELTLAGSVNVGSAITLAYTNPDTSKSIQDTTGNDAPNINSANAISVPALGGGAYTASVDNLAPTLISATLSANRTQVLLTYSESLYTTTAPDKAKFTVTAGVDASSVLTLSSSQNISSASISDTDPNKVVLTLSSAIAADAFVTVTYTNTRDNTLTNTTSVQDPIGNDAGAFNRLLVPTSNTDSVGPVLRSVKVDSSSGVNKLFMTYSEALNTFSNFTEGSGLNSQGTAVPVFSSATVNAGAGETTQKITGLSFTVSGLKDGANEVIKVDGTSIALTDGITGTTAVANNNLNYRVSVNGSTATVSLTKAAGIAASNAQTLLTGITYQNTNVDNPTPGLRVFDIASITDSSGANNATSTFAVGTNSSSVLVTALNDAPTITSSTATGSTTNSQSAANAINIPMNGFVIADKDGGNTIESLTFNMTDLASPPSGTPTFAPLSLNFPVGPTSLYATKVSDNTYTVYGTLADLNNWLQQTNAISYTPRVGFVGTAKLSTLRIKDSFVANADSTGTTDITVSADTQAPSIRSAVLSSESNNKIILNFDEPLNSNMGYVPQPSAFSISSGGTTVNPQSVSVVGSSVVLTTSSNVSSGVAVTYTDNAGSAAIQDAAGVHATTQTVQAVSDSIAPVLTNSMTYYNGSGFALNKFVLNFNEDMSSVCAATNQFTVSIVDPVYPDRTASYTANSTTLLSGGASSYGNTTVTFSIPPAFLSPSASVSVTYTNTSLNNDTNAIQDLAGNDAPNMVLGAWTNDSLSTSAFGTGKSVLVVGGQGNDTMTGGLANDTFAWFAGDAGTTTGAVDIVKSFTPWNNGASPAAGDKLDISKLLTNGYNSNTSTLSQWVTSITTAQTSPGGVANSTKIVIDVDGQPASGAAAGAAGTGTVTQTIWLDGVNLSSTDPLALKNAGILIA